MKQCYAMLFLLLMLPVLLTGCSASASELTGESEGYGGPLRVGVTVSDGQITQVRILEHHETEGIGTLAIDSLPDAIVRAGSPDVDDVSGATRTSEAIKAAVRQAIDARASAAPDILSGPDRTLAGTGLCATGRLGPQTNDRGDPVHTVNIVAAGAVFDPDGRILSLRVDQLEAPAPVEPDDSAFLDEVAAWITKGTKGDAYMMNSGSWRSQMDAYERLFTGMTVDEAEAWFASSCSDETGRPIAEDSDSDADQAKLAALGPDGRQLLTDVRSSATMSLRDAHGDILTAIRRAWEDAQRAR